MVSLIAFNKQKLMELVTVFLGLILVVVGLSFGLLLVLDAENQKQYKALTLSKVKGRQIRR